jgi:CPA2 family monovalent cation:H+ antiporter-2
LTLSITVSPILIRYNKVIANWFFKKQQHASSLDEPHDYPLSTHAADLKNHVILCGFGRVGQVLARFLEQEKIPTLALDLDPARIASSSLAGEHAFYGDVRRADTLAAAGLGRARMVVISFSDEASALETLKHIRALRADVPVFVRTRNDSNLEAFQAAGATEVVPESLEASLMLASHLLLTLGVAPARIVSKIRAVHADRYRIMKGFFKGNDDSMALGDTKESRFSLHAITVTDTAYAIGKKIANIIEPDVLGEFPVKAMIRKQKRQPDPPAETRLKAGDVLIIYATPEQIALIEEHILRGGEY